MEEILPVRFRLHGGRNGSAPWCRSLNTLEAGLGED